MGRPRLEVGDIFRDRGDRYRRAHTGHLSLGQLKVMSAIERCRSAQLGGHRLQCSDTACATTRIAYNSCRNRHCPKCQGAAAEQWLAERQRDLLPIEYYHTVFTIPNQIADIAYQNKAVIYDLLFKTVAETLHCIAADPKRLGARLGFIAVLHSWGSAMTHHPHIHCIVTGGGLSTDGQRWIACRPGYLFPHKVLSQRFRRLLLEQLHHAHHEQRLHFFGPHQALTEYPAFADYLAPLLDLDWYVHIKPPFAGPQAVLEYLGRYTHRVALANSRLIAYDGQRVTFWHKNYRRNTVRHEPMTLDADEFIRRFLLHVLPKGFHRIRHYGLLASHVRNEKLAHTRSLLGIHSNDPPSTTTATTSQSDDPPPPSPYPCPACGAPMLIIETLEPKPAARDPPTLRNIA
jgi:hypothetical protein